MTEPIYEWHAPTVGELQIVQETVQQDLRETVREQR